MTDRSRPGPADQPTAGGNPEPSQAPSTTEEREAQAERFNEVAMRDGAAPAAAGASSMPSDAPARHPAG